MTYWKCTLDLSGIWQWWNSLSDFSRKRPATVRKLGKLVAARLKACTNGPLSAGKLSCMAVAFEQAADIEEFDNALSQLYDWADRERVWVKTLI